MDGSVGGLPLCFGGGDDSTMMAHDCQKGTAEVQVGLDPTVQRFRPIFSAVPFSKLQATGSYESSEADMGEDERPQSARTVDGYSRGRDLMDIDGAFQSSESCVAKPRPLYGVHEDCFAHVLRFLPVKYLCMTARVSRDQRKACDCDSLWYKLCQNEFGPEVGPRLFPPRLFCCGATIVLLILTFVGFCCRIRFC